MTLDHAACLYGGTDDFLTVAVPFLRAGLEREEVVVAVAEEPNLGALRDVLGPDGGTVAFIDSAGFYRHPIHTLRDYQAIAKESAPRRVCALAEPVWSGWTERQTLEWIRYESLINVVFADTDAQAMCMYDTGRLPEDILFAARRTHPGLVREGANNAYVDPEVFAAGCDRRLTFDRPGHAEYTAIESADLHRLRAFVAGRAERHGLGRQAARNLVTAVNEAAANALRHGAPPVGLWTWRDGDTLVCEVGDHGYWRAGPLTGFVPPASALHRGFGLWTVRLLVDLVELRSGWDGTFVRMHVHR
ncbi:sensor histidine kinase [Spirillospora albida]|uniref:sensor histidine kinase n=1 Tax=Spirillospora albida TaxID=58123 RepID=UPI0004BEF6BE|nr:sensor histidine kinase [Spirillospora albida]